MPPLEGAKVGAGVVSLGVVVVEIVVVVASVGLVGSDAVVVVGGAIFKDFVVLDSGCIVTLLCTE